MFNWFGRKTAKDFMEDANKTYAVPTVKVPRQENKEHYRIGRTDKGETTLTMIADGGYHSMTLTMNQEACEQLIRMLESTFQTNTEEQNG